MEFSNFIPNSVFIPYCCAVSFIFNQIKMINVNMKFVRIFGKSCITSSPGLAMRHQITSIEARFISCIRCPLSPLKYNILLDFRRHLSSNVADEGNVSTNSALMKEHEAFSGSEDAGHRGLRLSKMIAETGVCSRREAEKRISEQRVSVNGRIVTDPWHRIDPGAEVWMDEYRLRLDKTYDSVRLWAVNKLRGELVADSDPIKQRPLIFDRIEQLMKQDPNLRPVTRLEFNTEGLLLLTNNGKLAKLLESSETGMERTFQVKIHGLLTESKLDGLKRGLTVKGVKYR
jgi:ribosomal 50S subunit-recycling heat shock protein